VWLAAEALSTFCETLTAVDLRTLATTGLKAMREVNEPTVETLQLLVIEEIEAALKATKTARRRQDRNAIEAVIETQEDHAAELVQTVTEAYFTEADVSGHCHSKSRPPHFVSTVES